MIARIEGTLESMAGDAALIAPGNGGGLTYRVLVPAYATAELATRVGETVTLHTLVYFESHGQGATMIPRMLGFTSEQDRAFFELFTTCKGIGQRKALRAMTLRTDQIAAAIADRDVSMLQTLPEVGKRTAETIVATLHGKVDPFVSAATYGGGDAKAAPVGGVARETLEVLMQLGENRTQAIKWIDQAMRDPDDRPADVEELVKRVYAIKSGA
jgi:Holliday junction DNA helicase RuvA